MEHEIAPFMQRKSIKTIPENTLSRTHTQGRGEKEENHFPHHRLGVIFLSVHPYHLMCIKYANMSQMFFVIGKHIFFPLSVKLYQWVGRVMLQKSEEIAILIFLYLQFASATKKR